MKVTHTLSLLYVEVDSRKRGITHRGQSEGHPITSKCTMLLHKFIYASMYHKILHEKTKKNK